MTVKYILIVVLKLALPYLESVAKNIYKLLGDAQLNYSFITKNVASARVAFLRKHRHFPMSISKTPLHLAYVAKYSARSVKVVCKSNWFLSVAMRKIRALFVWRDARFNDADTQPSNNGPANVVHSCCAHLINRIRQPRGTAVAHFSFNRV